MIRRWFWKRRIRRSISKSAKLYAAYRLHGVPRRKIVILDLRDWGAILDAARDPNGVLFFDELN